METQVEKTQEKGLITAKNLNQTVEQVINSNMLGFEQAFVIASAISRLKEMLTPEYMKPIMELQGQSKGFKTDKDNAGGYSMEVVRKCLIDAVLTGIQPYGNHFNIIAGNYYVTKEGFGYLLDKLKELKWEIIPQIPRIDTAKGSAAITMRIKWTSGSGDAQERDIDFAIKVNQYMGADAVVGKATRKARAWLYQTVSNKELPEGETEEVKNQKNTPIQDAVVLNPEQEKEFEADTRLKELIQKSSTLEALYKLKKHCTSPQKMQWYNSRLSELTPKSAQVGSGELNL